MNYYIDFEATQFSHRIISIGCVNEKGDIFYSLVKPIKGKINQFITELTGITKEDLENAPDPEIVFTDFRNFIQSTSNNEETFFFVYGDSDQTFIDHTIKFIQNNEIYNFGSYLSDSLIDYSKYVKKFFNSKNMLSLKKVFSFFFPEENNNQTHNALKDAQWLQKVSSKIEETTPFEITPEVFIKRKIKEKDTSNYIIIASPSDHMLQINPEAKSRQYNSMAQAVEVIYNKRKKNSPNIKKQNIKKGIQRSMQNKCSYCDRVWIRQPKMKG